MRKLALVAAALLCSAPVHAEWKQYTYNDLGVAKDFPSAPTRTETTYKGILAKEVPATVLSLLQDDIVYKVIVADLTARASEGANLALEVASHETGIKNVTFTVNAFPLWDHGKNSVYGVSMTLDNKVDGIHAMEDVVFNKGKLYIIQASVADSSPSRSSFALARFMDTIQFYLKGYGFNYATGHDYPLGDDDPDDRDNRVLPNYKPPVGLVSGPLANGAPH